MSFASDHAVAKIFRVGGVIHIDDSPLEENVVDDVEINVEDDPEQAVSTQGESEQKRVAIPAHVLDFAIGV